MKTLSLDLETYSSADLGKCGVYKYAEAQDFEILLFGYSVDGGEARVIDLACGESIPSDILDALTDEAVTKWAFNASFERVCLSRYLRDRGVITGFLDPESWRCSMVWSAYLGLPQSLKDVGSALSLSDQKMDEGKALIRYFSVPCTPTKANGERCRNLPCHAPDKWRLFKAYNRRDVEVEMAIQRRLRNFPVPDFVWEEYRLDQEINDRGIAVDTQMVRQALLFDEHSKEEITAEMKQLTGLDNPNSVARLKQWLERNGCPIDALGKKDVAKAMKTAPEDVKKVLSLRLRLAKSSVKKYQAMENAVCSDGRCRGMFRFYGANRTGRFASKTIQLQNLPQNHMPDLDEARGLLKAGNYEAVKLLYDDVPDTLSQLIRTAFVPSNGKKLFVADFSAIEARVLSWLAGETWRMETFANGGDIYCASASKMFGVPVEKHGVNGHLRQKGKIAELACIAEGQPVLTNHGLIPIEKVSTNDLLWDGENWVRHEGVVCKGDKEVIAYDGLIATADHLVFVEGQQRPVQFGIAATRGAHLIQTGNGGRAASAHHKRTTRVYDIRNAGRRHRFTVSGKLVHNCGYGGSVGAMKAMGALDMGLTEDELKSVVSDWRNSNPNIVKLWWNVDRAVKEAVRSRSDTETHGIRFSCRSGMLFITLPSGRRLAYVKPRIEVNKYGGESVTYMGAGATKKWERLESYGPKFVENITQAISRDILMFAMRTLGNCAIVAHVHDEIIIEAAPAVSLNAICEQMGRTPPWAGGLILRADGYVCDFYRKD